MLANRQTATHKHQLSWILHDAPAIVMSWSQLLLQQAGCQLRSPGPQLQPATAEGVGILHSSMTED